MNNKNNMLKPEEKEKNSKKDIYPGNLPQNYQKNIRVKMILKNLLNL